MGTGTSTERQTSPKSVSRTVSQKALSMTNLQRKQSEKSLGGSVNNLSAHPEGDEPGVALDFEAIALSDVSYNRWRGGVSGAFQAELGADYDSARGDWIRGYLPVMLEQESGRSYGVKFKRRLDGRLIVKFKPKAPVRDQGRSGSKLAAMLLKLEKAVPPATDLRLKDVAISRGDNHFKFSCEFDTLHQLSTPAQVLMGAIKNALLETYAGVGESFEDMPRSSKEFSEMHTTISYSLCDSSLDAEGLRSEFRATVDTICDNINLLTNKGYTAREIAQFRFLGEAAIEPEELSTNRLGLPRLIEKMHGPEFEQNKREGFWVHFANIDPGSALAQEIARLATKLLCQLFKKRRTVELNDDENFAFVYGENATHFAISGEYEPKIAKSPKAIYDVLFACIAQEIRRRQFRGLTHADIAADPTLEDRVEELVLARLGVTIPEKAKDRIVQLDALT